METNNNIVEDKNIDSINTEDNSIELDESKSYLNDINSVLEKMIKEEKDNNNGY